MSEIDPLHLRIVEVTDERSGVAGAAFALIAETFARQDRHSLDELRAEVAEKRHELLKPFDYHLLAAVDRVERVVAVAVGVYLAGVNAGFVDYLVVREEARGEGLGQLLRDRLAEGFAANAEDAGYPHLAAILGEVRADNPWLLQLVRNGRAVPLHLTYYHPALPLGGERYILYRQPVGDPRTEFPSAEVGQMLYAIYRRAYRVRYPLERETFRAMLEELSTRPIVGADPDVVRRARM
jgi:GNAT superfamily N-acetyltransferase